MKITESKLRSIIKSVIKESRFDDAHNVPDKEYSAVPQGIGISDVLKMSYDELNRLAPNEKYRIRAMLDDKVSNLQDEIELLENKISEISLY
jgi:hypothetical protein